MKVLIPSYLKFILLKSVSAITIWPFVFYKTNESMKNSRIWSHEEIHLRQQLELFILPFYLIYITEYLVLRIKHGNHRQAYQSISFEREAYKYDNSPLYLKSREPFAMWRK
ncbi:MAG: hypothetical protein JXR19_11580 [Bacteroidia bacterium]